MTVGIMLCRSAVRDAEGYAALSDARDHQSTHEPWMLGAGRGACATAS